MTTASSGYVTDDYQQQLAKNENEINRQRYVDNNYLRPNYMTIKKVFNKFCQSCDAVTDIPMEKDMLFKFQ